MNKKRDLQKELEEVVEEKTAIQHKAHLLKLREIQLQTLVKLEDIHQVISEATPEEFGVAFDLFQKSTAGKKSTREVKELEKIKKAVMKDEEWHQKVVTLLPTLTDEQQYVLEVIGRTGISRNQALREFLEHIYLIRDCATEFKDMGYAVLTEQALLRFDLPSGKQKVFDLIIEKDGEKAFIELERGTHTEEDFFNSADRTYEALRQQGQTPAHFYFITPNEKTLFGKTKRRFFTWIKFGLGGIDEVKGKITVHFTTFDKIKKRQKDMWEVIEL